MTLYKNETHDEERAFYGITDALLENCTFDGPADGESALKETSRLDIRNCRFLLRYPLWHTSDSEITGAYMSDTCRAALWYDKNISVSNSELGGIKAVRECDDTIITDSRINSTEFGWFCRGLKLSGCELKSEYPFLHTSGLELENVHMTGKYSFQYVENAVIRNSVLDTKDAFWHGKNITVYDSVVKGEYLGWYSEGLKFVRCHIIGTQPLCYAKDLVLEDCEMTDCDLSFEKSSVRAAVKGGITGIKNPAAGIICADFIEEIITDEYGKGSSCKICTKDSCLKKCV